MSNAISAAQQKVADYEQNLRDAIGAQAIADMAEREANISGLKNSLNAAGDAYRHMIVSAELTRRFGPVAATAFGYGHELTGMVRGQPLNQAKMDVTNNAFGVEIGLKAKTLDDVIDMARNKMTEAIQVGGTGKKDTPTWIDHTEDHKWPKNLKTNQRVTGTAGYKFVGPEHKLPSYAERLGFTGQAGEEATARQDSLDALTRANLESMGVDVPSDDYLSSVMKAVQDRTPEISASASPGQLASAIATTVAQELSRKRPGVTATLDGKLSAPPVRADIIAKSVEQTIKSSWVPEDPVAKSWGVPSAAPAQPQPQAARPNSVTVQSGDTLSEIAFKHKISVRDLMLDNPHIQDPNRIDPGDVIDVSSRANIAPATSGKPTPPTKAPKIVGLPGWPESSITAGARAQVQEMKAETAHGPFATPAQAAPERDTITVEDANLTNFAKRHNTTWHEVFNENKDQLSNPNYVTAGMSLKVPRKVSQASAPQAVTEAPVVDQAQATQVAAIQVQAKTNQNLAAQAKVDAATESANTKSYAVTAAKTAQAENASFALSHFTPSKQTTPAKKTTLGGGASELELGGYGRSMLDGTVPELGTMPAAQFQPRSRTGNRARDGGSNTNNGANGSSRTSASTNDRMADMTKSFSNMSLHGKIDAARAAR